MGNRQFAASVKTAFVPFNNAISKSGILSYCDFAILPQGEQRSVGGFGQPVVYAYPCGLLGAGLPHFPGKFDVIVGVLSAFQSLFIICDS